jgi:hypothetical protein
VQRRGGDRTVPQHLGVVVGVQIDEAGGDDEPRAVDGLLGRLIGLADGDDAAVAHTDICGVAHSAGAIDDGATNEE